MESSLPTRGAPRRGRWLLLAGLVLALVSSTALPADAASPPPAPATTIQAWLDSDSITPDAPPGGMIDVGVTFWDTSVQALAPIDGVFVRLHPAKGKAAPSEGRITADFPGHVTAALVVPKGGPGAVTVGVHSQSCDASGACRPVDIPMRFAGTGPPPDAKPFDLVEASFEDIVGDVVAGRPTPLTVDVMPRGLWDIGSVGLTDQVDVIATNPNDRSAAQLGFAALERQGDVGTPYVGTIVIRSTGPIDLAVALPIGGTALVVAGEHKQVTVIEAGARPSTAPKASEQAAPAPATPEPVAPSDGVPPIVWIVLIAVVVIVGGYLLLRFLADQ